MFATARNSVLTFIPSQGSALFTGGVDKLRLRSFHGENSAPRSSSVRKTARIVKAVTDSHFLHLDIRTPFGEPATDESVHKALDEALGPKRGRYHLQGWHLLFAEDTNQGSNHRIFAGLIPLNEGRENQGEEDSRYFDECLPLEAAIEALAEKFAAETGTANFQFLLLFASRLYSLVFVEGQPFHLLRLEHSRFAGKESPEWDWPRIAQRLAQHREFACMGRSGIRDVPLVTPSVEGIAPLSSWDNPDIRVWDCGCGKPAAGEWDPSRASISIAHLGLALATVSERWSPHDRLEGIGRARNTSLRHAFLAGGFTFMAILICLAVAGFYFQRHYTVTSRIATLKAEAGIHAGQVAAIETLRANKAELEKHLARIQPVWKDPIPWHGLLDAIASALPEQSGMEGLSATQVEGATRISFKVWVRDWDQVGSLQEKLSASDYFSQVELSEQKRDPRSGIVAFYVNCRIRRI